MFNHTARNYVCRLQIVLLLSTRILSLRGGKVNKLSLFYYSAF